MYVDNMSAVYLQRAEECQLSLKWSWGYLLEGGGCLAFNPSTQEGGGGRSRQISGLEAGLVLGTELGFSARVIKTHNY